MTLEGPFQPMLFCDSNTEKKGQELTFLVSSAIFLRWELVGSVSHCRAGAGVAVCSCLSSQIRDVGQGSSNVVDCM